MKLFGGSKEALAGAETYIEAAINLGEVRNSGTTVLTADLTPPEGFEKIEPSSVTVEVTAVSHGEREITGIPITLKESPPAWMPSLRIQNEDDLLDAHRCA